MTLDSPYRQLHWLYLCFVNSWLLLDPSFLCADWTMGTIPLLTTVTDLRNLLTLATFVMIISLGLYGVSGKSPKALILGLALMLFPYIPASNLFFPVGFVVAERVLYIPSMGFCMLVALGVQALAKTGRILRAILYFSLFFLLLTHSLKTLTRNRDWHSDVTLFSSAIQHNPGNGKVYNNLGHEMERAENYTFAEHLFRKAAETQPDDIGAYINLGRVLKQQERYDEAEQVSVDTYNVHTCLYMLKCLCTYIYAYTFMYMYVCTYIPI